MTIPRARFDASDPGLAIWQAGTTYQLGDAVIYDGAVWEAGVATVAGTAPAASLWTEMVNPVLEAAIAAPLSAISATETQILTLPMLPGVSLNVGTRVRATVEGICTSSNADAVTFTVRAGVLGTKADASVGTAAVTSAGSGSAIPFKAVLEFTVETLGAAGTAQGQLLLENNGVTGIAAAAVTEVVFTSSTLATTTATNLGLTLTSAATSAVTVKDAVIEVIPAGYDG